MKNLKGEYVGEGLTHYREDQPNALSGCAGNYIPPTTRQRLQQKQDVLTAELEKVRAAIQALDDNPTFEKVHDLLQKAL